MKYHLAPTLKKTLFAAIAASAMGAASLPASAHVTPNVAYATYAGYVNQSGTILAGSGFSVTHNSTGSYSVTYPSSKFTAGFPAMTVTGFGLNGIIPIAVLGSATCSNGKCVFNVLTYSNSGSPGDNAFVFTIVQAH